METKAITKYCAFYLPIEFANAPFPESFDKIKDKIDYYCIYSSNPRYDFT